MFGILAMTSALRGTSERVEVKDASAGTHCEWKGSFMCLPEGLTQCGFFFAFIL
jgi:hypothetical protein